MSELLLKVDRKEDNKIRVYDNLIKNSLSFSFDLVDEKGATVRYGRQFVLGEFTEERIREMIDLLSTFFKGFSKRKLANNIIDICKKKKMLE